MFIELVKRFGQYNLVEATSKIIFHHSLHSIYERTNFPKYFLIDGFAVLRFPIYEIVY
jgi:hypothetical protein